MLNSTLGIPALAPASGYMAVECIARMRALQHALYGPCALRWHGIAAPAPTPLAVPRKARKAVVAKAPAMTAEQFFDARMAACRAVARECGPNWHLVEGASHWCTIPAKLRSFKTSRGTTIKSGDRRYKVVDARLPAARFWPGGALPEGVVAAPDMPRDRTPREVALWQAAKRECEQLARAYAASRDQAVSRQRWRRFQGPYASYATSSRHDDERKAAIVEAWNLRRELREMRAKFAAMPVREG